MRKFIILSSYSKVFHGRPRFHMAFAANLYAALFINLHRKGGIMEKEKKEEIREQIVVLDEGIDADDIAGPRGLCCWGTFMPFRW